MNRLIKKRVNQLLRKSRIRARVTGTTERPRLSVSISNRQVSAQIIDDSTQRTIVGSASVVSKTAVGSKTEKAAWVGADIAKKAKKAGVTKVVLDRNGRHYQGRLSALADNARKEGLEF
jgi:large subunit ribosomal protein L18